MGSLTLDITTRGLEEAHQNVKNIKNLITEGTYVRMIDWYNHNFKETALSIIDSGEGMAANKEPYATWKRNRHQIDHPLGRLTGMLYLGVQSTEPTVKETRGKEVRLAVTFDDPYYLAYVVDGDENRLSRDFIQLARDREWPKLLKSIGTIFNNADFTLPPAQLRSTILTHRDKTLWNVRG